jgi:LPXTG-site transpeptidase (sortase) family protein
MVQDNPSGDQQPNPQDGQNPVQALLEKIKGGQLPLPLLGGVVAVVVLGIVLIVVALSGGGGDDNDEPVVSRQPTSESGGLQTRQPTPQATIDLARPTSAPAGHWTTVGPDVRFVIPRFEIDAPVTYRQVPSSGEMPNPDGPDDVAYYDFSSFSNYGGAPGLGGNAVFAGHVDSGLRACNNGTVPPPCQAVLWDLNLLEVGDVIEVHANGEVFRYEVATNEPVSATLTDGTWDQIVSSTDEETLTIITCGGDFNRETREYTNRQVVTATRIAETASAGVSR